MFDVFFFDQCGLAIRHLGFIIPKKWTSYVCNSFGGCFSPGFLCAFVDGGEAFLVLLAGCEHVVFGVGGRGGNLLGGQRVEEVEKIERWSEGNKHKSRIDSRIDNR